MTLIMGILNVTPDSFSDGGRWADEDAAIRHGLALISSGADLLDVGGESTRPGADPVDPAEERRRILPVIAALVGEGVRISVDTVNADTAAAALGAGAEMVNDVSAGQRDPGMLPLLADARVSTVLMHSRGRSDSPAEYRDVVTEVRDELAQRIDLLIGLGGDPDQVIIDPGLGFAKNAEHNWALLHRLDQLHELGYPVLVGTSRKRFLGALLPAGAGMEDRDLPTAVTTALAARAGAWGVRVHDAAGSRQALDVVASWDDAVLEGGTGA